MPASSILQKGLLIVLVPFAINLIWIGLFCHSLQRSSIWIDTIRKDGDVLLVLSRCIASMNKMIIAVDECVTAAGSAVTKKQIEADGLFLLETFSKLRDATKGDSAISSLVGRLSSTLNSLGTDIRALAETPNPLDVDFHKAIAPDRFLSLLRDTTALMTIMKDRDDSFNRTLEMEDRERYRTKLIAFGGLALNLAIAVVLAVFLQRNITGRIAALVGKARALTGDACETKEIGGADELNQLDNELMAARHQLQAAYRFRHTFMTVMAKKIQGPLHACIAASENLERNEPAFADDVDQRHLRALQSSASSCLSLIDDLLLLESLESGSLRVAIQPAEMKAVASAAIELVASLALSKNVSIANEVEAGSADMDQARIKQVLVNLISNAIKFSPPGADITITSKCGASNLRVSITDNGPGIDKKIRTRLFQKFYQSEDGKAAGGTGLGLAISKLIIDAHQGLIGVDSTPGQGSTFWFELPTS